MYAALGIAAVFWLAYAERLPVLGLDGLQLAGLWLALVLELFVLTACWGRSASGGPPDKLRHRVLWTTVVVTLLFSFFQNYASYRALLDRLDRLHADVTAQSGDVRAQLLQARYTAEQLKADVIAWSTAPEGTRASAELRVTSDLVDLRGRAQEAAAHLDDIVKSLGTSAPPGSGAATLSGSTLSGSMLTSVRNLADDATQENTRMSQVLQGVEQDWNDNRSKPGMAAELQSAVDPKLWAAIDNAANALEHFEASFKNATTIPVSDLFVVMAVLDLSLVLFPWLLLLLFVSGRREIRIRRIYLDLWALGGGCNALLVRVLDGVPEAKLKDDGYRDPEVQRALEGRTFSDVEYLLSLSS